jgi:hypothetical protein
MYGSKRIPPSDYFSRQYYLLPYLATISWHEEGELPTGCKKYTLGSFTICTMLKAQEKLVECLAKMSNFNIEDMPKDENF